MIYLIITLLFPLNADSYHSEIFIGFAYDLKTEKLLYSEEHSHFFLNGNLMRGEVVYRAPGGDIMATKTLNFDESLIAPSFRLEDRRFQHIEGAERKSNGISLIKGKIPNLSRMPIQIPSSPDLVIDAGFDHFVRKNWSVLSRGEKIDFLFGSPSEQRVFKFQLELKKKKVQEMETHLYLKMSPSSLLLRWLVDPIDLCYIKSKNDNNIRLQEYKGITNINRTSDEKYRAVIRFPSQK